MNRPDDFDTDRMKDEAQSNENTAPQSGETEQNRSAQWYSVSYQTQGEPYYSYMPQMQEARAAQKGKGGKIALIATVLALAVLLSALAGFGGALLAGVFQSGEEVFTRLPTGEPSGDPTPGNQANTQSGVTDNTQSPTYEYTDTAYDYAAALGEIVKNNDASLIGSANGSAGNAKKSLIEVTNAVKDSVVEITTTTVSNRGTISAGAGSGVIIHEDGIIVTNNHVIADCDNVYVRLTNGDTYEASIRGTDEDGDIALIKITPQVGKPLTVAKLGYSKALALGEEVIAIGNPLGELGGTVTNGIISSLEREVNVDGVKMTLLQTNAAINSGNSGGGLFNMAGELIGVVNAKYSASGVEGLGFAIPIDTAFEKSFCDLLNYGYIKGIATLGLTLVDASGGSFFNPVYGAYVYSTGTQTGFQEGDYIYSIDGTKVYEISTPAAAVIKKLERTYQVGDKVSVVVIRRTGNEDSYVTVEATMQEYIPPSMGLAAEE